MSAIGTPSDRILVVDDDRLVLATVTHGLAQAGYDVIDADNGDDAILLAREYRPVLALLDIRMEGKSGFDVAETLRDAYRIPFMFLSAFADQATRDKVQALGALDYLIKPVDVGRIVPAVEAALARVRRSAAELAAQAAAPPPLTAPVTLPVTLPATAALAAPASPTGELGALADPLPLAVGVLMHRHSLGRVEALQRLHSLARAQGLTPAVQADRLLGAVEELARTAG